MLAGSIARAANAFTFKLMADNATYACITVCAIIPICMFIFMTSDTGIWRLVFHVAHFHFQCGREVGKPIGCVFIITKRDEI